MSDTTHEAPERIVPSCVEALESYHQADMDGIMVLASRQAIHETIDAYWARVETCEELEAKLAKAVGALGDISNGEPEWPDDPQRELDWCRNRATTTLAELSSVSCANLKGQDDA